MEGFKNAVKEEGPRPYPYCRICNPRAPQQLNMRLAYQSGGLLSDVT